MFYYILLFLVLAATIFIFTSIFRGFFLGAGGAPWVPLAGREIGRLLKIADLNENSVLCDLGSGDGRILIAAVKNFKARRAIGIEISRFLNSLAKLKIKFLNLESKIELKRSNFFNCDLSGANIIICYLMTETLDKLKPKFNKELSPGTLILTFMFSIPGWQPVRVDKPSAKDKPIYIYRIIK